SSFYIWGSDVKYRLFTLNIADTADAKDRQLAEGVKQEATTRAFTGSPRNYSALLTLEDLAKRGVTTQISFEWLEPDGWSGEAHSQIEILNKNEIKTSEINSRVSTHVHLARLRRAVVFISLAVGVSVAALACGIGVAWVVQGFAKK